MISPKHVKAKEEPITIAGRSMACFPCRDIMACLQFAGSQSILILPRAPASRQRIRTAHVRGSSTWAVVSARAHEAERQSHTGLIAPPRLSPAMGGAGSWAAAVRSEIVLAGAANSANLGSVATVRC